MYKNVYMYTCICICLYMYIRCSYLRHQTALARRLKPAASKIRGTSVFMPEETASASQHLRRGLCTS